MPRRLAGAPAISISAIPVPASSVPANSANSADVVVALTLALGLLLGTSGCATPGHERLPSLGVAELAGDVQVARVKLESYYFEPARLRVQVGVPVRLILDNGTILTGHDFSLFAPEAALEINAYVPARQQVTVQFLPQKAGEYVFYCNIDDHAERGMRGVLEVIASRSAATPSSAR